MLEAKIIPGPYNVPSVIGPFQYFHRYQGGDEPWYILGQSRLDIEKCYIYHLVTSNSAHPVYLLAEALKYFFFNPTYSSDEVQALFKVTHMSFPDDNHVIQYEFPIEIKALILKVAELFKLRRIKGGMSRFAISMPTGETTRIKFSDLENVIMFSANEPIIEYKESTAEEKAKHDLQIQQIRFMGDTLNKAVKEKTSWVEALD